MAVIGDLFAEQIQEFSHQKINKTISNLKGE
jgi:hypothetical protein